MSNTKAVRILATVPFNWLNEDPGGVGLTDNEMACIASLLMEPSTGLTYEYVPGGYIPNEHGGRTAMYGLSIGGQEALSWPLLKRLVAVLAKAGTVRIAEAMDVQWPDEEHRWEPIAAELVQS